MRCAGATALAMAAMLIAGCSAGEVPAAQASATPSTVPASGVSLDVQMSPHGIAWAQIGQGRPLLLLNGTASPMSEWDPQFLAALAGDSRVIVFDYPGLGASTAPAQRNFTAMSRSVSRLLSDIGVPSADVLGWSMGGFIAQELMRSSPQQVRSAVLLGTNPGSPRAVLGPPWVQRADSNADAGVETYLRTNYPGTRCAQRAGRRFLDRLADAQNSGRFPESRVPAATNRKMVAAEDPWLRSSRNLEQLAQLRTPVLVMVGRRDVITPVRNSRILARRIPGAQLTLVPGAGHSVAFQAPRAVAGVISGFLAGRSAPRVLATRCG